MSTPNNKSIIKAIDLVELVCSAPDGLTLREAANATGLSLPTTHRILHTLKSVGAVVTSHDGMYMLGPRLLALHEQNTQATRTVQEVVQAHVTGMLNRPGMCVRLSILDPPEVYVVAGAHNCANPKMHSEVGARYEAYCNAPGKVLLASLGSRELDDYTFGAGFVPLTLRTIVVPSLLADEIKRVHLTGYAIDNGEFRDEVRAVAVPVRTGGGQVIAALSIAGESMPLSDITCLVPTLTADARVPGRKTKRHSPQPTRTQLLHLWDRALSPDLPLPL